MKIRMVFLRLDYPVRASQRGDPEDRNSIEWFRERKIALMRHWRTPNGEDFPVENLTFTQDDLLRACSSQDPPIMDEGEILLVTDLEGNIDSGRMLVLRVGHRGLVTVDTIIDKVLSVEHASPV